MRRAASVALALALAVGAVRCGKKGPPRPPLPRGPMAPRAVDVRQMGTRVLVAFDLPAPRGPGPAQAPARAELLRVEYRPGAVPPPDPDAFRRRGAIVETTDTTTRPADSRMVLADESLGALTDRGVGWTLRYGVRVRDRRARSSPLVLANDLVVVDAPPPPGALRAEATADGIRLAWQPPGGVESPRYRVYRGAAGGPVAERPLHAESLSVPEYLDAQALPGTTYAYVVRTAAADGTPLRESESSEVAIVLAEDRFAPAAPRGLVGVQEGGAVRLFWDPSPEKDVAGYRVYRRSDGDEWARTGPEILDRPLYLDAEVVAGRRFSYRVTAVDRASPPNESDPSEPIDVDVGAEPVEPGGPPS